ncbi:hypothetical protein BMI91_15705 [Thioclava sediminum]|uniref:Aminoglycoside phosphotransferase domain-containing protein n=1 Tax=Thioclava sediminum TaxID=1915319 RepID=A0ABX3MXP3_9RHOB|nr:phosphotransferase [Thioclava sediminum]OOY22909.1 hypothetical protein BMI91_15705 [Thioclava sediminum]
MADEAEVQSFLTAAGWHDASRRPLAGDASARSYERLTRGADRAVLMKAPDGAEIARFTRIGYWLAEAGFSTPNVLARDDAAGLLLLEDFGDALAARHLDATPEDEPALYALITEFLADMPRHPPPEDLPLLDGPALADLLDLVLEFYPCTDRAAADALKQAIADKFDTLPAWKPVLCLRDFHAENIILLDRPSLRRLGLLDYQDALRAHPAYDLVSALQDARRDVSPRVETAEIAHYCALTTTDPGAFQLAYRLLGLQRALRILGIFARLTIRDGKPQYLEYMPRVYAYISRNLADPALADLAELFHAAYPAPDPNLISDLRRKCPTSPTP